MHQLRYVLAYGSHAAAQLSAHGDHYVATATVTSGALVAVALGLSVLKLPATWRGRAHVEIVRGPLRLLWLGLILLLFAGYCALEGLETVFEPDRAAGIAEIFGSGGWWALPAAAFVAGLVALLVHGGHALLVVMARRRLPRRATTSNARPRASRGTVLPWRPMASCAPGRAPPVTALV